MSQDTVKPFVVAMTFGVPPNQKLVVGAELAVNQAAAVAIAVSKAHVDNGVTDRLESLAVAELTPEFIEAAHRGSAAPAPVLSIVPQDRIPNAALSSAYEPPSQAWSGSDYVNSRGEHIYPKAWGQCASCGAYNDEPHKPHCSIVAVPPDGAA